MTRNLASLIRKRGPIRRIGVVGMGYVGIPAAALFADVPHFEHVYGFQRDSPTSGYKIAMLNRGESPLKGEEPGLEELLKKVVGAGKFSCTADFAKIAECDAVTLAIQTPFADKKDLLPDFTPLIEGLRNVGRHLTPGTLVVLESTITPGTTTGMAREILEAESGLVAGKDFALAHAPERVMVGRLLRNIREHDRIVGGIDEVSTKRAVELSAPVLATGNVMTATAENTFRDLQIAAVNQLALSFEAMGVNVYACPGRGGIAEGRGGGDPLAGVGGHCLTKDTWSGCSAARPSGRESLSTLARGINDFMPAHMVHLTESALREVGKSLKGSTIALLGRAFINDSDDARNTPAGAFFEMAKAAGAEVRVHDPWVDPATSPGAPPGLSRDLEGVLSGADAVVVFAGHVEYRGLEPARVKGL